MLRRSSVLFLLLMFLSALSLADTVTITQGETVVLNLRVVNNAEQAIVFIWEVTKRAF